MHLKRSLWLGCICALMLAGCGPSVRSEKIPVNSANDPLNAPRSILGRYADGQELGSEVATYPKLVEDVRKVDPARADVLEKGLDGIKKAAPPARPGLAKALLSKLQPSMK